MREWFGFVTDYAVISIDALALIIIVFGTIEAFIKGLRFVSRPDVERRIWLDYGRWLVAGLTFQLAADIIETSVTTSWDAVGRLAAVAAIRTFLDHFLERDLSDTRQRR